MFIIDIFLCYFGGKIQLLLLVSDFLCSNDLFCGVYVELFVGGVGVVWCLLLLGYVSEVWLNDIDLGIYSFWKLVLEYLDDFCELI